MNKKAFLKEKFNLNLYVLIPTICLIILGIVMIYSASSYTALKNYGSSMFFASKQIIGAVVGLFAMMFFYFFDYNRLSKTKYIALAISLIVLAVVFIPGVGIENYGAKRWIGFGSFSFQASEIAKFCFIVFCAGYMAKHKDKICTFK